MNLGDTTQPITGPYAVVLFSAVPPATCPLTDGVISLAHALRAPGVCRGPFPQKGLQPGLDLTQVSFPLASHIGPFDWGGGPGLEGGGRWRLAIGYLFAFCEPAKHLMSQVISCPAAGDQPGHVTHTGQEV